jgi:hypothetical protein
MTDDLHDAGFNDLTPHERTLFARLPREATTIPGEERVVLRRLRGEREGSRSGGVPRWTMLAAAGIALAFTSGYVGARIGAARAERRSIEGALARSDLSIADRVLLMQRAGSAYVLAAQGYAAAAKGIDSAAVQVASQVLVGAARAVARSDLDGGLSAPLTVLLEQPLARPTPQPVIWY